MFVTLVHMGFLEIETMICELSRGSYRLMEKVAFHYKRTGGSKAIGRRGR